MNEIICPVCKCDLIQDDRVFKCENNHCFDVSKFGVLNLSLNNKSSKKRHGDDKLMVLSRKAFLDNGYYEPIRDSVVSLAKKHINQNSFLLDAGCGEGYYTEALTKGLGFSSVCGIDVSKEALRYFKKRLPLSNAIVSSIFNMPVKSNSVDLALNMFAPVSATEFARVIKKDGFLIRTFVLKEHLFELKQSIYDTAYYNDEDEVQLDGFELVDFIKTEYVMHIEGEDIKNLFCMTPYYYKTSEKDQKKLELLDKLDTTVSVMSAIYKKL